MQSQSPSGAGARLRALIGAIAALSLLLTALVAGLIPPAAHADPGRDAVDVSFGGAFSNGNEYTAATGEAKEGTLERVAGTETQIPFTGLQVPGADGGVKFTASQPAYNLNGSGNGDMTRSFRAEILFQPNQDQVNLATVFAAGGNLSVRYQNGVLRYGLDSNDGGWQGFYQHTDLPPAGKSVLVQVEYAAAPNQTIMRVWVNGVKGPEVLAGKYSRMEAGRYNVFGFGTEVHPAGTGRGLTGILQRIRLGAITDDWKIPVPDTDSQAGDDCDFTPPVPAHSLPIAATECKASIKAKLSALRPTPSQAGFLDAGLTAFIHYGINTYTDKEWGYGNEDPSAFNPTDLDTDQWAKALADAGFRYAILTVKHHDGFTLYPSRYNPNFGVQKAIHFRNGQGDVVREFVDSARKFGLQVGFYVSPADGYQERAGVYANGSPKTPRQIPTLVTNDDRTGKLGSSELPGPFTYKVSDYGQLFMNTLYELLTQYGPIDEVWFDGAAGNTQKHETFDHAAYFDLIRKLQPKALIAVAGPDVRWVGNEGGLARPAEWSPQGVETLASGRHKLPQETHAQAGDLDLITNYARERRIDKLVWYPAEADVSIRPGWFYHDNQQAKPLDALKKIFRESYGRNSVLLMNVPPNRAGKFAEGDIARLNEWKQWRDDRYGADIALGKPATVAYGDNGQAMAAPELTDGSHNRAAANPTGATTGTWSVDLGTPTNIDAFILAEPTRTNGQQVASYALEAQVDGQWRQVATGKTIGARQIVTLASPVAATGVRLKVLQARGPVQISKLHVHPAGVPLALPQTIYLDTAAPQPGDGSIDHPFNSVDQLLEYTLPAGTKLMFKRGTTVTGNMWLRGYGTAENPILVEEYGEGAPVKLALDNSDAKTLADALIDFRRDLAGWRMAKPETVDEGTQTDNQDTAEAGTQTDAEHPAEPGGNPTDKQPDDTPGDTSGNTPGGTSGGSALDPFLPGLTDETGTGQPGATGGDDSQDGHTGASGTTGSTSAPVDPSGVAGKSAGSGASGRAEDGQQGKSAITGQAGQPAGAAENTGQARGIGGPAGTTNLAATGASALGAVGVLGVLVLAAGFSAAAARRRQ